ncbi:MAG: glycosyl transferase [Rhodospirillaceae bacterium]|nr:glycosyl transferase [Rhodospirillaceae bacterium]MBT6535535.1 glycosyl transferase [Rhodospirillaceae bacterium]
MIWTLAIIAAATALASAALVGLVRVQLLRHDILDRPNERSSHDAPTPRGGGLGVLAALLPAWVAIPFFLPAASTADTVTTAFWVIPLAALFLAGISWVDDLMTIGPLPRLGAQFAAALAGAFLIEGAVFQGLLPGPLDMVIAAIGWVWFMNLFNFMDGIDGISGVEAFAIGIGLLLIGVIGALPLDATHGQALAVAAAAAGFLVWNWPPARIFLGDSGSIPLGYLLGWLLLSLAANGAWQAAAILPLYYLVDATITLFRRIARGEKFWCAHRDHFYQAAIKRDLSHARVSTAIALVNLLLIGLALFSVLADPATLWPWLALLAAVILVALLLVWLAGPRKPA